MKNYKAGRKFTQTRAVIALPRHSFSSVISVAVKSSRAMGSGGRSEVMQVLAVGKPEELIRPCIDCGLWTACYCDYCYAADRMPNEQWVEGQMTPLCSACDNARDGCHFCHGKSWCMPPPRRKHAPP